MQRVTDAALEPAAIHAVVALGVADGGLDRLAALEPFALLHVQRLDLAAVDELYRRNFLVHASVSEVDNGSGRPDADAFEQRVGLFELRGQRVSIVGVAGEAARAHHQPVPVRDGQADLDAELVGLARLARDAFDFRGVQRHPRMKSKTWT